MKYMIRIWAFIATFLLAHPLFAHGDAEELGHHWDARAYVGEMRIQFVIMATLAVILIVSNILARMRRNRRAGQ
ncbi:MAG: hypothetical protein ABFD49_03150 [Armatimonadota bacterium]|nr:hypothetical protein [bacterium]